MAWGTQLLGKSNSGSPSSHRRQTPLGGNLFSPGSLLSKIPHETPQPRSGTAGFIDIPRVSSQLPRTFDIQDTPPSGLNHALHARLFNSNPNTSTGMYRPVMQHSAEEIERMFNPRRRSALQNLQYPFEPGAAWRMMPPQPMAQAPTSPWAAPSSRLNTPNLNNARSNWQRNSYATRSNMTHHDRIRQQEREARQRQIDREAIQMSQMMAAGGMFSVHPSGFQYPMEASQRQKDVMDAAIFDDVRTLMDPNASPLAKAIAAASLFPAERIVSAPVKVGGKFLGKVAGKSPETLRALKEAGLTKYQADSYKRLVKSVGQQPIEVYKFPSGTTVFQSAKPARNIPQSYTAYQKVVPLDGSKGAFGHATYDKYGNFVHFKEHIIMKNPWTGKNTTVKYKIESESQYYQWLHSVTKGQK